MMSYLIDSKKECLIINNVDFKMNTIFEISAFTILWNMFEREKCNCRCTDYKLKCISQANVIDLNKLNTFALALKNRASLVADNDIEDYVRNYLVPPKAVKKNIIRDNEIKEEIIKFIKSDGKKFLLGGLLAIKRLRNNIFHGLKEYNKLDDQIELIRSVNNVLKELVK